MCQINSERVTHALKAIAYTDDIGARIFDCYCQFLVSFLNGKDYFLVFPPFEVWMIFAKWLWMWWKTVQEIYKLNQLCWLDIQLSGWFRMPSVFVVLKEQGNTSLVFFVRRGHIEVVGIVRNVGQNRNWLRCHRNCFQNQHWLVVGQLLPLSYHPKVNRLRNHHLIYVQLVLLELLVMLEKQGVDDV